LWILESFCLWDGLEVLIDFLSEGGLFYLGIISNFILLPERLLSGWVTSFLIVFFIASFISFPSSYLLTNSTWISYFWSPLMAPSPLSWISLTIFSSHFSSECWSHWFPFTFTFMKLSLLTYLLSFLSWLMVWLILLPYLCCQLCRLCCLNELLRI